MGGRPPTTVLLETPSWQMQLLEPAPIRICMHCSVAIEMLAIHSRAAAAARAPCLARALPITRLGCLRGASCTSSTPGSRRRPVSRQAPLCSAATPPLHSSAAAEPPRKRLAVFVSGGGSNFKAIHAAIQEGGVHGEVVAVVSNAPACGGAEFARAHGIPTLTYPAPKADPAAGLTAEQLVQQLTQVLAWRWVVGGMRMLGGAAVLSASLRPLPPEADPSAFARTTHTHTPTYSPNRNTKWITSF